MARVSVGKAAVKFAPASRSEGRNQRVHRLVFQPFNKGMSYGDYSGAGAAARQLIQISDINLYDG